MLRVTQQTSSAAARSYYSTADYYLGEGQELNSVWQGQGARRLGLSGEVRALAVMDEARSKFLPDVPTTKEAGYPTVISNSTRGIAGPKGMDPKIVAKLHDAFKKAIEDPSIKATLAKYDMVVNYKNTEDYVKSVKDVTEAERNGDGKKWDK